MIVLAYFVSHCTNFHAGFLRFFIWSRIWSDAISRWMRQGNSISFCANLGKSAKDTLAMIIQAFGEESCPCRNWTPNVQPGSVMSNALLLTLLGLLLRWLVAEVMNAHARTHTHTHTSQRIAFFCCWICLKWREECGNWAYSESRAIYGDVNSSSCEGAMTS
jgi:hypothetical protein